MTVAELRTTLAASLSDLLGTYTMTDGNTTPAIFVGEPPSDWNVAGLEVRIAPVPDLRQLPAYHTGAIVETHQVRLVTHGAATDTLTALRRILSRWATAQATDVPASERLGVLSQHTITIPT